MEKKILAAAILVIFVAGAGWLGYVFGQKRVLPPVGKASFLEKFIDSGLTRNFNVSVSGKIAGLAGTTLTIAGEESSLSLEVPKDAVIFRQPEIPQNKSVPAPPEQIGLEGLKTGDRVSVSVSFTNDDKIAFMNIMVLSEPASESPLPVPEE